MRYIIKTEPPKALVITPSINPNSLSFKDCLESVSNQIYENTEHLIVFDGIQGKYEEETTNRKFVNLPYNTGANGFYGHRIYAAFSKLVDADYVFFLDEDNWFEPNHVSSLVSILETNNNLVFAYSLRKIHHNNGSFVCNDDSESLGKYPTWYSNPEEMIHLVDTSSYVFRNRFYRDVGHIWDFGWGADRRFYMNIMNYNHLCSGLYTSCYRLHKEDNLELNFINGNKFMNEKYKGRFPWNQ